jgi:uncharacterized membrane-anchored protein YhcB (DUF1043 family)
MPEVISTMKIGWFLITGGLGIFVSIMGFLIRRELNRNKDVQDNLHKDIKDLKRSDVEQQKTISEHETKIAVMKAEKIDREEMMKEMTKMQHVVESQINNLKSDLKEDMKELKDEFKDIKDLIINSRQR